MRRTHTRIKDKLVLFVLYFKYIVSLIYSLFVAVLFCSSFILFYFFFFCENTIRLYFIFAVKRAESVHTQQWAQKSLWRSIGGITILIVYTRIWYR